VTLARRFFIKGEWHVNEQMARKLETCFQTYNDDALRLATRLVGTHDRGEDVVMSVWLRLTALLARQTSSMPEMLQERPRGYLLRAVRNMATDHLIQMRREAGYRVEICDPDLIADEMPDAVSIIYARRKIAVLAVAINGLPRDCRRAFILFRLHGKPHREIAALLGVSVSMVEKHIVRALRHCRSVLAEAGY
jgi:RNA polymerase sigma-70 factor (ECF subfamily)